MDKENNVVYVETKKGIFKCYKSEQMHKPIYYPIESKTNGYIDYYDVIRILNIDDLYEQVKKQKEVIDKVNEVIDKMINDGYSNGVTLYCATGEHSEFGTRAKIIKDILKEVK